VKREEKEKGEQRMRGYFWERGRRQTDGRLFSSPIIWLSSRGGGGEKKGGEKKRAHDRKERKKAADRHTPLLFPLLGEKKEEKKEKNINGKDTLSA